MGRMRDCRPRPRLGAKVLAVLHRFGPFLIPILVMAGSFLHIPILGIIITPFVRFFSGLLTGIPNLI